MTPKHLASIVLAFLAIGISSFFQNSPQAKWKGKIIEKDGVVDVEGYASTWLDIFDRGDDSSTESRFKSR